MRGGEKNIKKPMRPMKTKSGEKNRKKPTRPMKTKSERAATRGSYASSSRTMTKLLRMLSPASPESTFRPLLASTASISARRSFCS
jgi:hypothetical protein